NCNQYNFEHTRNRLGRSYFHGKWSKVVRWTLLTGHNEHLRIQQTHPVSIYCRFTKMVHEFVICYATYTRTKSRHELKYLRETNMTPILQRTCLPVYLMYRLISSCTLRPIPQL